jgi:uncharacterized membrane protein YphA (DoxX/SURF4 family)
MSAAQLVKQLAWRLYRVDENSKATDVGLLLIRVTFCLCLFYHHGAEKFYDFHTLVHHPLDPVGIGVVPSVLFAGLSDGICSLLVLFGFFSRYAAAIILICLNTVWWIMDHGLQRLLGLPVPPRPGASATQILHAVHSIPNVMNVPMYILGALVVFIAGPGRYSIDKVLQTRRQRKAHAVAPAPAD